MTDDRRRQELLRLASEAAQPQLTEPQLHKRFGPPATWPLRPGAVWRARWDNTAVSVVLISIAKATSVTVAPVTFSPETPDEDTLVMGSPASGPEPMSIWRGLRRELHLATLDRPLDVLPPSVVLWATGGPVPSQARAGEPGLPPGIRSSPVRGDLLDDLDALGAAAPVTVGGDPVPAASPARLAPSREQYAALKDRLGIGLPSVLDLVDGKRPATTQEADVLQAVLGVVPKATQIPSELVVELSHPRWKKTVLDLAGREGLLETAARVAMTSGVFALAARQTGDHTPNWRERTTRWVDAAGLDRW